MRHPRRGFTLIEILVVIGIIMILVGLLVVGYRHLNAATASKETKSELHVLRGMLTEYEGRNGLAGIEVFGQVPTLDPAAYLPAMFPVYVDPLPSNVPGNTAQWPVIRLPSNAAAPNPSDPLTLPGVPPQPNPNDVADNNGTNTDMGDKNGGGPRTVGGAVLRTQDILYVLMRVPANKTVVQSTQSKRIMQIPSGSAPPTIDQGAVLLDGWGNPIIFVPRGGIHVYMKDPANPSGPPKTFVVRSTGTLPITLGSPDPKMTGNERPFWASAGQDGDFTQGEDNVYSFQE